MPGVLLADLGGTNLRLARVELASLVNPSLSAIGQIQNFQDQASDPYAYFAQCAAGYHDVEYALIALAGPVSNQLASVTARQWQIDAQAMAKALKVKKVHLINDFPAQAMAVPYLDSHEILSIHHSWQAPSNTQPRTLVCGPGTGLGVSVLHALDHGFYAQATEAGHSHFSAVTDFDWFVSQFFSTKYGRASWERLISGQGLADLHQAFALHHNQEIKAIMPAELTQLAHQGDALATQVVEYFVHLLGRFAGDMVLTHGATGLMLAGGVYSHLHPLVNTDVLLNSMQDKGRFSDYLANIPVAMNTCKSPGLLGAMALAKEVFYQ